MFDWLRKLLGKGGATPGAVSVLIHEEPPVATPLGPPLPPPAAPETQEVIGFDGLTNEDLESLEAASRGYAVHSATEKLRAKWIAKAEAYRAEIERRTSSK